MACTRFNTVFCRFTRSCKGTCRTGVTHVPSLVPPKLRSCITAVSAPGVHTHESIGSIQISPDARVCILYICMCLCMWCVCVCMCVPVSVHMCTCVCLCSHMTGAASHNHYNSQNFILTHPSPFMATYSSSQTRPISSAALHSVSLKIFDTDCHIPRGLLGLLSPLTAIPSGQPCRCTHQHFVPSVAD
jgi:hypothetical protein